MKQCLRKATSAAPKWPLDLQSLRPVNLSNSERDSLKRNAIYLGISWEHWSADHACHGNRGSKKAKWGLHRLLWNASSWHQGLTLRMTPGPGRTSRCWTVAELFAVSGCRGLVQSCGSGRVSRWFFLSDVHSWDLVLPSLPVLFIVIIIAILLGLDTSNSIWFQRLPQPWANIRVHSKVE